MDELTQLDRLIELAEELGIEVRRTPAIFGSSEHPGGDLIKLKGKEILFLEPLATVSDQISVAATALAGRQELNDKFIEPEIRDIIDSI